VSVVSGEAEDRSWPAALASPNTLEGMAEKVPTDSAFSLCTNPDPIFVKCMLALVSTVIGGAEEKL
jgi:hypothetical protein